MSFLKNKIKSLMELQIKVELFSLRFNSLDIKRRKI